MLYANARKFPHDTVDGETVIIDSVHGRLFLLTGSGPWIWQRMVRGATIDGLADDAESRFGPEAGAQVRAFLEALAEHGMLTQEAQDVPEASADVPLQEPFAPPQLEKYDEISDIIAMDPIHDVDPNKGWPHR